MDFFKNKLSILILSLTLILFTNSLKAEEEEILLQSVSDQIQVIIKDLKTLEKAVYQKSDISSSVSTPSSSDSLSKCFVKTSPLSLDRLSILLEVVFTPWL